MKGSRIFLSALFAAGAASYSLAEDGGMPLNAINDDTESLDTPTTSPAAPRGDADTGMNGTGIDSRSAPSGTSTLPPPAGTPKSDTDSNTGTGGSGVDSRTAPGGTNTLPPRSPESGSGGSR